MTILKLRVTNSKRRLTIQTDDIPEMVYRRALQIGLETILNGGRVKPRRSNLPNAKRRLEKMLADTLRFRKSSL